MDKVKVKIKGASGYLSLKGVDLTDKVFEAEVHQENNKYHKHYSISHVDLVEAGMKSWGEDDDYKINFLTEDLIFV